MYGQFVDRSDAAIVGVIGERLGSQIGIGNLDQPDIVVIIVMGLAIERVKDITLLAERVIDGPRECAVRVGRFCEAVLAVIFKLRRKSFSNPINPGARDRLREFVAVRVIGEVGDVSEGIRLLGDVSAGVIDEAADVTGRILGCEVSDTPPPSLKTAHHT